MMNAADKNHVMNNFFRGSPMSDRDLKLLQSEFQKEMESLKTTKGCTKCKKNALRRKWKSKLIDKIKP